MNITKIGYSIAPLFLLLTLLTNNGIISSVIFVVTYSIMERFHRRLRPAPKEKLFMKMNLIIWIIAVIAFTIYLVLTNGLAVYIWRKFLILISVLIIFGYGLDFINPQKEKQ